MDNKNIKSNVFLENTLLLENLQGGIVYSDFEPPFHLRYVTEGMAKLSGYSREELVEMRQMDIVHEDDQASVVDEVNRQFAKGDTFEIEYRLLRKDGSSVYILDRAKIVIHDDGNKYIHCLLTDISGYKQLELDLRNSQEKYKLAIEMLTELSQKDGLTGIYNRITIENIIKESFVQKTAQSSTFMMIDIDYFKNINDEHGHVYGDDILKKLAKIITNMLPSNASFGRLGGDEFLLFLPNISDKDIVKQYAQSITTGVRNAFANDKVPLTISMGVYVAADNVADFKIIYKMVDAALYEVKEKGRNGYVIY